MSIKWLLTALFVCLAMPLTACNAKTSSSQSQQLSQSTRTALSNVQKILTASTPPTWDDFNKAVSILTSAIDQDPKSMVLLQKRGSMYTHMHNYKAAIADYAAANKIAKLPPVHELFLCMLADRVNGYSDKVRSCYLSAEHSFEASYVPGSTPSVNYVAAALMAGGKNADRLKQAYLAKTKTNNPFHNMIKNFNREEYIHQVLP